MSYANQKPWFWTGSPLPLPIGSVLVRVDRQWVTSDTHFWLVQDFVWWDLDHASAEIGGQCCFLVYELLGQELWC